MKLPESIYAAESERLKLSRLLQADAKALFAMYSDAEAMKFRGSRPMKKMQEAYQMINTQLVEVGTVSRLRIGVRTAHHLIGTTLLTFDEMHMHEYEIGFSFGKPFWGMGFGQETLALVEAVLWSEGATSLKSYSIKENFASIRILEKAGFAKTDQSDYPSSYLFIKKR